MKKTFKILLVVVLATGALAIFSAARAENTVHVRIEGATATIFDGNVAAGDCTVSDNTGKTYAIAGAAVCALDAASKQGGFSYELKNFGTDASGLYLNKISDEDTVSHYWGFWPNYDYAVEGISTYQVREDDSLLLGLTSFATNQIPLRITVPASVNVGETVSMEVKQSGAFDGWNFISGWQAATGASLHVGDKSFDVPASGTVSFTPDTAGDLSVWADGDAFLRSTVSTMTVSTPTISSAVSPSPVASLTPSPSASPTATPSVAISPSTSPTPGYPTVSSDLRHDAARRALAYLKDHQQDSGLIESGQVSAWAAMAFGANSQSSADIKKGGNSLLATLANINLPEATDLERQILAVRATGANPRSFNGIDLTAQLKNKYHDGQIGQADQINDDIFGVLALLASSESSDSSEITGAVSEILSKQGSAGDWSGSVDMTAAAIQSLRAYQLAGGGTDVAHVLSLARDYLKTHQDSKGGFGDNSASTAWGIQAIIALGENPNDWNTSSEKNPWFAFLAYQNDNGGFGWQGPNDVSNLMTTYAVPALLDSPWPIAKLSQAVADGSVVKYDAAQTVRIAATGPTPRTVLPSPQVAGIKNAPATAPGTRSRRSSGQPVASPGASPTISATPPEASVTPVTSITPALPPLTGTDTGFTLTLFGLANMGVGVTITRLIFKLL